MNAQSFAIRPARLSDLDVLHRLETECVGGSAVPLAQMRWLLEGQGENPSFVVRVAVDSDGRDEPIGFICWKLRADSNPPGYEILDLSVGKHFREERVEHALLTHAIETGTREGMAGISVNVPRANMAAAAFYLSHAFVVAHAVDRYYADGSTMEVFVKRLK